MVPPKDKKPRDADDVFEFLESLPESKTINEKGKKGSQKDTKHDDEIFEFLDELEKSNMNMPSKSKVTESSNTVESTKSTNKSKEKDSNNEVKESHESNPVTGDEKQSENIDSPRTLNDDGVDGTEVTLNDPITSITNWWSSSGSAAVSGLWNKTQEQASQLKNKITQEPLDITSKINPNRITDLARHLQKLVVGETEEVLRIHLVHDLINYPELQDTIEYRFDQVFSSQVQDGIRIFVDEWGYPNKNARHNSVSSGTLSSADATEQNDKSLVNGNKVAFNLFQGKFNDGEKLAFANLDNAIELYRKAHEEIQRQKHDEGTEAVEQHQASESKISDLFISILPMAAPQSKTPQEETTTSIIDSTHSGNFCFTIVLKDITNDITSIARSQAFPLRWIDWVEGTTNVTFRSKTLEKGSSGETYEDTNADGNDGELDTGSWVKQWIEDGLSLSFGVVAQNYVIERMGL